MRNSGLSLILGVFVLFINASNSDAVVSGLPEVVQMSPRRMFAPRGFDDNDNVQIVLDGEFSNTSFKAGPTLVDVDHVSRKIIITDQAYWYRGFAHIPMIVPYIKTVDLGVLGAGVYEVVAHTGADTDRPLGSVNVAVSPNQGPDDHLYAPVREAFIKPGSSRNSPILTLRGDFTDSCTRVKEIRVMRFDEDGVIVVMPLAERLSGECGPTVRREFEMDVALGNVPRGRRLIHVRALNGQSINSIVDFR